MTFSGNFNPDIGIKFVRDELKKSGFFLNNKKTVIAPKSNKQCVTGIIVNKKPNIPCEYKKAVRQELYYCKKYGVSGHMTFKGILDTEEHYIQILLGKLNYILSVCRNDKEFIEYRDYLINIKNKF